MKFSILLFVLNAMVVQYSNAQQFLRTDVVNGVNVQVYSATVIVDLPSNSKEDLDKALLERNLAYRALKEQATELANTRVVSVTEQTTNEEKTDSKKKGKKSNSVQSVSSQKYSQTIHVTSAANVEIKPISEAPVGKMLKTEIEIRVSPIEMIAGAQTFTPEALGANELFQKLYMNNGQKYLITFKKPIVFDLGYSRMYLWSSREHHDSPSGYYDIHFDRESQDIMQFGAGSFVATSKVSKTSLGDGRQNCSFTFEFKRGGEKFNLTLTTRYYGEYSPSVAEFLEDWNTGKFKYDTRDLVEIKPAFQFKPRMVDGPQDTEN